VTFGVARRSWGGAATTTSACCRVWLTSNWRPSYGERAPGSGAAGEGVVTGIVGVEDVAMVFSHDSHLGYGSGLASVFRSREGRVTR
jgi:hypothetical protein